MDIMEILEFSKENNEVIEVYTNPSNTKVFSCGIVSQIFDNEVVLNHYTAEGRYDGYLVKRISDIYNVECENRYSKKIKTLSEYHRVKHEDIESVSDNGFISVLNYAYENDKIVTLELLDSGQDDIIGFVSSLTDECCAFSIIDEFGINDGVSVAYINDISYICCDGDMEIMRKVLYKHNSKNA